MAASTAAAEPPDEPPGMRSRFQGLTVAPWTRSRAVAACPNSDVIVLPSMIPPARRVRSTMTASASGMLPA